MQLSLKVINRRMTEDFTLPTNHPITNHSSFTNKLRSRLALSNLTLSSEEKPVEVAAGALDSTVSTKDDEQGSAGREESAMDRMRRALKGLAGVEISSVCVGKPEATTEYSNQPSQATPCHV